MSLMKIYLLFLLLENNVLTQEFRPCNKDEGNFKIEEAFRIGNRIYFITDNIEYYIRCDGIDWNPNSGSLSLSNCLQVNHSGNILPKTKAAFPVRYEGNGTGVLFIYETKVGFSRFFFFLKFY